MVSGEAVGPDEFLSVDDFALLVLIDYLAHTEEVDPTIRDLARRIISRDLFKLVPCSSSRISDFLRKDGGEEQIYNIIGKHLPEPRYYLIKDVSKFSMLSEQKDEWSYFVDSGGIATSMREHEAIRPLWREIDESVRLFAPREVVHAVAKLIG
jgi:hypothetical protein